MKTSVRKIIVSLSFLLTLLLASCAGVQSTSAPSHPEQPEPGKGLIVFYRESSMVDMAVGFKIEQGGQAIGGLPDPIKTNSTL